MSSQHPEPRPEQAPWDSGGPAGGPSGGTAATTLPPPAEAELSTTAANEVVGVTSWRTPVVLGLLSLVALLLFGLNAPDNTVSFRVSEAGDLFRVPDLVVHGVLWGWLTVAVLALAVDLLMSLLQKQVTSAGLGGRRRADPRAGHRERAGHR